MTLLNSLIIQFSPCVAVGWPRDLGRAVHALLLRLIAQHDSALAEQLHSGAGLRPFTCSNVAGGHKQGESLLATPDDVLWVRFTGLSEAVSSALTEISVRGLTEIEVDNIACKVHASTLDPARHFRAGATTYEQLAAPYLLAKDPPSRRITLRFSSPTAFKARGQYLPLPLPGSVFGSLADKWNEFAPLALPPDIKRFADECLAISRFKGRTRVLRGKDDARFTGFTGAVRYNATNSDRYWLGLINVLADFAWYAGVGYQTTQGMGQCRRFEGAFDPRPRQATLLERPGDIEDRVGNRGGHV
jgi:CRISPR-associated endoribonuclease Cas6